MAGICKLIDYFTFKSIQLGEAHFHLYILYFNGENTVRLHGKSKDYTAEQEAKM